MCLCFSLPVYLSICVLVWFSACLSVCLSVRPAGWLAGCLSLILWMGGILNAAFGRLIAHHCTMFAVVKRVLCLLGGRERYSFVLFSNTCICYLKVCRCIRKLTCLNIRLINQAKQKSQPEREGAVEIARVLLEAGADKDAKNNVRSACCSVCSSNKLTGHLAHPNLNF